MYVCIDQNCGVTTEGGEEEEEEANISLLFLPFTRGQRERERGSHCMDRYFSLLYDEKRGEREREQGESDIASIRGMCVCTLFRRLIGF